MALQQAAREKKTEIRSTRSSLVDCPDPVLFCTKHLGFTPWERQVEVLQAIAKYKRVAVRSGHKVGKSDIVSCAGLWWVSTKKRGQVIMTGSGGRQVTEILWAAVLRLRRNAKIPIGGRVPGSANAGLTFPDGRRMFGFATETTEKMGGFSGDNLLFIVDEASGVDDPIFKAIEGNMAGGASMLMIGNPTRTSGVFFDAFHSKREFWHTIHISSEETPNVTGKGAPIPGLATKDYIELKQKELGVDDPEYQIRIRGDFPDQSENAVIGRKMVALAMTDWRLPKIEDGPLEVGVDPAGTGTDKAGIIGRRGKYIYPPIAFQGINGPTVCGRVMEFIRENVAKNAEGRWLEKPIVKVDKIGIGQSAFDHLEAQRGIEVVGVNVGEGSDDDLHERLRDRVWFACREWLNEGGKLPPNEALRDQLIAPTYTFTPRGRRKVESKQDLKERLGRSPDEADALCLAVFKPEIFHSAPATPESLEFMRY